MSKKKQEYAPATCTFDQLVTITSDNFDVGDFWIFTDTYTVTLAQQKTGEGASKMITIPRRDFNRLICWYLRPQKQVRK